MMRHPAFESRLRNSFSRPENMCSVRVNRMILMFAGMRHRSHFYHCKSFISILNYSSSRLGKCGLSHAICGSLRTHHSSTGCIPPHHGRLVGGFSRDQIVKVTRNMRAATVAPSLFHSFGVRRVKMAFSTPHCLSIRHSQQAVHDRGRVLGIGRVGIK